MNAVGQPQAVLLLGATSDIGRAVVGKYVAGGQLRRVLLAGRPSSARDTAVADIAKAGIQTEAIDLDATSPQCVPASVTEAFATGEIDVALLAFGVLGDQKKAEADAAYAVEIATVNYLSAIAAATQAVIEFQRQGHGTLVVFSSVAGERPRSSNFVYGSTKAGLDAFANGLSDAVRGSGVNVVVVRPGFVHSKMTAGMKAAPLATTPDLVADIVVSAVRKNRQLVWAPGPLRWVMSVLRHVPRPVFRKLPV